MEKIRVNNWPRILVVGNLGYIGPVLVKHLIDKWPCTVTGFDTGFFGGCQVSPYFPNDQMVSDQVYADVRDIDPTALPEADVVIYLAAISNDPIGNVYEKVTSEVNHLAAREFAKLYKEKGCKSFIYAGSCSVYGEGGTESRNEHDSANPLTAYARSKIDAENALRPLADDDFSVTCLRFATACGVSPRLRLDLVLNDFVVSALKFKSIKILSDGSPWRPLIDVHDMCRAIAWSVDRKLSCPDPFLVVNVGFNDANYQIVELAEAVNEFLGGINIDVNDKAEPDRRSYRVDFSFYKKLCPENQLYKPIRKTIEELCELLADCPFDLSNFRRSHLIRLNVLQSLRDRGLLDNDLYWTKTLNNLRPFK